MYHRSALIEKNCSFRLMADKRKFLIDKYDTVRRRQYLFCPCPAVLSCPGFLGQDNTSIYDLLDKTDIYIFVEFIFSKPYWVARWFYDFWTNCMNFVKTLIFLSIYKLKTYSICWKLAVAWNNLIIAVQNYIPLC